MTVRRAASATTIATYTGTLSDFITVTNNISLNELQLKDIDVYAEWLHTKEYKPTTFRNKLSTVKSFINYLWVQDLIPFRPDQVIMPKFKETQKEANFLSVDEVKQLVGACTSVRDKAMLLTLIYTCVRVSEFIDLRIEDLYERSLIVRSGKGGKRRVVFITPTTEQAIYDYLKTKKKQSHGYLFPNPYGNKLSRVLVARKVSYYAKLAGIDKKVTTHTLRHTGATLILRGGARVEDTQKILGHANIRTTMIYLHFTDEDLHQTYDESMQKLESISKNL